MSRKGAIKANIRVYILYIVKANGCSELTFHVKKPEVHEYKDKRPDTITIIKPSQGNRNIRTRHGQKL